MGKHSPNTNRVCCSRCGQPNLNEDSKRQIPSAASKPEHQYREQYINNNEESSKKFIKSPVENRSASGKEQFSTNSLSGIEFQVFSPVSQLASNSTTSLMRMEDVESVASTTAAPFRPHRSYKSILIEEYSKQPRP